MPDPNTVTTALRNELVAAGLVRKPKDAGAVPPMHVEPHGGPPAPFEREAPETDNELVATVRYSGDVAMGPGESRRRVIVLDVVYRSNTTAGLKRGRELDAAIRSRLVEQADYGLGITLDDGGPAHTHVLQATIFGGLGPVDETGGVRTELAKYALEVLAA